MRIPGWGQKATKRMQDAVTAVSPTKPAGSGAVATPNNNPRPAGRTLGKVSVPIAFGTKHGHQIFVYVHSQSNRVVYSLTKALDNNHALKQLPFLGKKSVPAALRRDLWSPLCVLSFPHALQGLDAFQKLRELKHLHEVAGPRSAVPSSRPQPSKPPEANKAVEADEENDANEADAEAKAKAPDTPEQVRRRSRLESAGLNSPKAVRKTEQRLRRLELGAELADQRANSVADMAAVLALQAQPPTRQEAARAQRMVYAGKNPRMRAKRGPSSKTTAAALEFRGRVDRVGVWWAARRDAQFAATWPAAVRHGHLAVTRGRPVWPPPNGWAMDEVQVQRGEREEVEVRADEREGVAGRVGKAVDWVQSVTVGKKDNETPARRNPEGWKEEIYESVPSAVKWYHDDEEVRVSEKIEEAFKRAQADVKPKMVVNKAARRRISAETVA